MRHGEHTMTSMSVGRHRFVVVVCGCGAELVKVRGLMPAVPRQLEPQRAIDGVWIGEWRNDFRDAIVEVGGSPDRAAWRGFVAAGRRPSFDGWSARCRRSSCRRVVEGHIDDLVEFVRNAIGSGERRVVLTSETLAAARPKLGRGD